MRWLLRFGAVILVLYGAVLALLYTGQRALLFPRSTDKITAAQAGLQDFEDIVLTTPDGERLVAWWKPPMPGKALILYFHGNGGSLWNRRFRARSLTQSGRGLLLVSYRGYAGSTGSPSEEGLRIDAHAAYAWATLSYEPARIVLYGESLGTGVAVHLAAEREVGGLILDAPYTSTADVAQTIYWYVPVNWLMRDQFRSLDRIGAVRAPILVMHGERDGVIPIGFGERLFAAAPEPKQFLRIPGAGHSRNLESGGGEAVDAFLSSIEARLAPAR
jgi:fermentation-respiration switch protein FrsA (DUF1100 family)